MRRSCWTDCPSWSFSSWGPKLLLLLPVRAVVFPLMLHREEEGAFVVIETGAAQFALHGAGGEQKGLACGWNAIGQQPTAVVSEHI